MSGGTVKFDESYEVATSLALTDRMFSLDLGNGKNVGIPYQLVYDLFKSNMDQLYRAIADSYTKEEVNGLVSLGMVGIEPTDSDDTVAGIKFPLESGTYTNYGGIVVDLTEGVTLIFSDGSGGFTKVLIPINLTGYRTASETDELLAKKADYVAGKNLFNINAADNELGVFIGSSGNTTASGSYNTTGFIKAVAGEEYTASWVRFWRFYDSEKNAIGSNISNVSAGAYTATAPAGAAYQRLSIAVGSVWSNLQLEEGDTATAYEPYTTTITLPGLQITAAQGEAFMLKGANIGNTQLPELLERTVNLFDKEDITPGNFINWNTGALAVNEDYDASGFMPVQESTQYVKKGGGSTLHRAWYNSSKVFISGDQTSTWPVTSPVGAAFARVTIDAGTADVVQFEAGAAAGDYTHFGWKIKDEVLPPTENEKTPLKFVSFGDSLTAQNKWQTKVLSVLASDYDITHTRLGIGGTQMGGTNENAFWQDVRINAIPLDTQLIIVMGGTNDWANNRALGSVNSTSTDEYAGAMNKVIEKIIARVPGIRIVFGTPPWSEFIDFASRGWSNAYENLNGHTINDYAAKVREVCLAKNLPVVDFNTAAAWNGHNITEFMTNDGALLHPNQTGADRMATELIAYIKKAYSG